MAESCRFISGDPGEVLQRGEEIYCGRPVHRCGEAWCAAHRAIVYETMQQRREQRLSISGYRQPPSLRPYDPARSGDRSAMVIAERLADGSLSVRDVLTYADEIRRALAFYRAHRERQRNAKRARTARAASGVAT